MRHCASALLLAFSLQLSALVAHAQVPDPKATPGVMLTNIPIETILSVGYTKTARKVSEATKRAVYLRDLGYIPAHPGEYEVDHLIPLEWGGANDLGNLFLQTYSSLERRNAHVKDRLENKGRDLLRAELKAHGPIAAEAMRRRMCAEIAADWPATYAKYVGRLP